MQEKRQTLVADFAVRGRLAYLSHQETLTCLARALLRAGVPVVFSGGFNPRPRVSIPLPRSVGTQSDVERLCAVLSTAQPVDCGAIRLQLGEQLPTGCVLSDVWCVEGKRVFHPSGVCYVFTLAEDLNENRRAFLAQRQKAMKTGQRIEVQRYRARQNIQQPFDISGFVEALQFSQNRVEVCCRVSREGTVRIDELMQWLQLETEQLERPVTRTAIQWEQL